GVFEVPVGPAVHIDLAFDEPTGEIFISKQASKDIVGRGEFIQYKISVRNETEGTKAIGQLQDKMPKGFRYQKGSLAIDGAKVPDPQISADGRELVIDLPQIALEQVEVSYVAEVTSGAELGLAVNEVTAIGKRIKSSNVASATVTVKEDLFRNKATVLGNVYLGKCVDGKMTELSGMEDARVYMEDGTYVVTDADGSYHIEGINPGSHVVQLDLASLAERYEVSECITNSRFAGTPYSQFIDVQGGTLWRADFYVEQKPDPEVEISLTQSLKRDKDGIQVLLTARKDDDVPLEDIKAVYRTPAGWKIESGTVLVNGKPASPQSSIVGNLIALDGTLREQQVAMRIAPAKAPVKKIDPGNQMIVFRPQFSTRSSVLPESEEQELIDLVKSWNSKNIASVKVVGHTDNVPIAPRNRTEFADNQVLSLARAESVARTLRSQLPGLNILAEGAGDRYPVASNETREGRQSNRRVELLVEMKPSLTTVLDEEALAKLLEGKSSARLMFSSVGTPKGKTESNEIQLTKLVGNFDLVSATATGKAIGSWDIQEDAGAGEIVGRDPDVQGLINIKDGTRLVKSTNSVKFDLDSRLVPQLSVDGKDIPKDKLGLRLADDSTGKTLYSYIGIEFGEPGHHELVLRGVDGFGNVRYEEIADVIRVGEVYDIRLLSVGENVSDGRTPVSAKLELRDRAGELINATTALFYESDELRAYDRNKSLSDLADIQDGSFVDVSIDGTIRFNPVTNSGLYRVRLSHKEARRDIEIFVAPEKREWIMVGIAEGTLAHQKLSGNIENLNDAGYTDEFTSDGRVSFYAKGQIKGEYILTIAYDTDKVRENALTQIIDPNSYYTLYGDQTTQQYDAASQRKLYLKLEKDQYYALFGDFSTGLTVTELSTYSRTMNGLKTEFKGEKFELNAFISEANQAFVKDEIPGDGTSGIYRLSSKGIVRNSERIALQTRDRFHSEDIVEEKNLTRHIDYNIDYDAGTLFFKQPVFGQDLAFNPVFIVVDYEVEGDGKDKLNAGGRVAYKPSERAEVGLTVIKEGVQGKSGDLVGIDLSYELSKETELRAEVARSSNDVAGVSNDGQAFLAEATHRSENLEAQAYVREQEDSFGLGQQNESEGGTRKIGVRGTYQLGEQTRIEGEVYRESDLGSDSAQDVASTNIAYDNVNYQVTSGIRTARASGGGTSQQSNLLNVGGSYNLFDGKAKLSASADTPIGGSAEAGDFPKRLRVGLDYKITQTVSLTAEQEFTWGGEEDSQGTRVGLTSQPWKGGELISNIESRDDEDAQRMMAVAGLRHRWDFSDNLAFDFGVDRSQTLKQVRKAPPALEVTTVYSSPGNDDYTSVTLGSAYRKEAWDWMTRLEYKAADSEDKMNFVSDVIHNLDKGKQMLAKVDIQRVAGEDRNNISAQVQLAYSYRPLDSKWRVLNRLDLASQTTESADFDTQTRKVVNNLNANYMLSDVTQISMQYGLKYVVDTFDADQYSGFTDLYGLEVRHDLTTKWDLGFQGSRYNSWNADNADYSYGVSVGYSMARNVWMSLGYNFAGFADDDFSAAEYTAKGIFMKYRFKFDQNTFDGLMNRD
ncbi:MAG: OmpA family protein, partial [Pseudomonadales bacterium]|nr:OmpA family protein [Pseudomonadales bacterium]